MTAIHFSVGNGSLGAATESKGQVQPVWSRSPPGPLARMWTAKPRDEPIKPSPYLPDCGQIRN